MPDISVVMPVYNAGKYLEDAIMSILQQSYKNFEFIIINDCSTDNTPEILRKFQLLDQRIMVIENKVHAGIARSSNKGLQEARGNYIARMDADDISEKKRLEKEKEFLDSHPEAGIVGSWFQVISAEGNFKWSVNPFCLHEDIYRFSLAANPFCHGSIMGRIVYFKGDPVYQQEYEPASDYQLWLRIMEKTRVYNIPEYLYRLREHNQSAGARNRELQDNKASRARMEAITRRKLDYSQAISFSKEWRERCFYYNYACLIKNKRVIVIGDGWKLEKSLKMIKRLGCKIIGITRNYTHLENLQEGLFDFILITTDSWRYLRDQLLRSRVGSSKIIYSSYVF